MELFGYIAGFCTTVSFIPQVLSIYNTKSAKDVSMSMYLIFFFGVIMWLIYGLSIQSKAIIWTNLVTLVLTGSILVMKIVFERKTKL